MRVLRKVTVINEYHLERHVGPRNLNAALSGLVNTLVQCGVDKDADMLPELPAYRGRIITATDLAINFQLGPYHNILQPTVHLIRAGCSASATFEAGWQRCDWRDLQVIQPCLGEYPGLEEGC